MTDPAFDFHAGLVESSLHLTLGGDRITLLCLGVFECALTDWFHPLPQSWPPAFQAAFAPLS